MKKSNIILIFVLVLMVISWVVYSMLQPPEWVGNTADNRWKTTYEVEYAPKNTWKGVIHWKGEREAVVTKVELTKNGSYYHGWEADRNLIIGTSYDYLSLGPAFHNRGDTYVLNIHWTDNDELHEETLTLSPQTRYFVLPSFVYKIIY